MATPALMVDWGAGLTNAWNSFMHFVPELLMFIVVLVVGYILGKVLSGLVGKALAKVGFGKVLDKSGISGALQRTGSDMKPESLITKLVFYFILLIALETAVNAFGPGNPLSVIVSQIVNWLPKAFVAVLIIVIVAYIAGAVKDLMRSALGGQPYGELLAKIVGIFIIALGVIAALNQVGIATTVTEPILVTVLVTIAGVTIVGVGGGLIQPMRSRWEGWLSSIAQQTSSHQASRGTQPPGSTPPAGGTPPPGDNPPPTI